VLLRSAKCMILYLLSKSSIRYLVSEENELTENGKGFKILGEGPGVVSDERFVE